MYVWMNRLDAYPQHHPSSDSEEDQAGGPDRGRSRGPDQAVPCGSGWLVPANEAVVQVTDRGFLLGDGLFETMLLRHGRVPYLAHHTARFNEGARLLSFPPPPPLEETVPAFVHDAKLRDAVLRVTYTRGSGPRGYLPPEQTHPFCLISPSPIPPLASAPWRAILSGFPVLPHPILSRVKHTSSLARIIAFQEAAAAKTQEALLCTPSGAVSEGTSTNVFWVASNALHTPDVGATGCLPGVARRWVIEWAAAQGLTVREGVFPLASLVEAEEAFLTNAVRGAIPLKEVVGHRAWDEAPGAFTQRVIAAWEQSFRR